jgi:hypothetical protein
MPRLSRCYLRPQAVPLSLVALPPARDLLPCAKHLFVAAMAELIAEPEERLSLRSQIALSDEAAIARKDDCIGFTLARDFDPREIGLVYYVMASSQTLGDALKRLARYSKITNEALVFASPKLVTSTLLPGVTL